MDWRERVEYLLQTSAEDWLEERYGRSSELCSVLDGTATKETVLDFWKAIARGEFNEETQDFMKHIADQVLLANAGPLPKRRPDAIAKATGLVGDEDEYAELRRFIHLQSMFDNPDNPDNPWRTIDYRDAARGAGLLDPDPKDGDDHLKLIARLRANPHRSPRGVRKK